MTAIARAEALTKGWHIVADVEPAMDRTEGRRGSYVDSLLGSSGNVLVASKMVVSEAVDNGYVSDEARTKRRRVDTQEKFAPGMVAGVSIVFVVALCEGLALEVH